MKRWGCLCIVLLQLGCSLGFAYEKHIIDNFYLLAIDDEKSIEIAYKLQSGGFVGKTPEGVIAYGILHDSLIVAEVVDFKKLSQFYVIRTKKNSEYDEAAGPLNIEELKLQIPEFNQSIMKMVNR